MRRGRKSKLSSGSLFKFDFDPLHTEFRIFSEPTLPYTYHPPAQPPELLGHLAVPSLGTSYLVPPLLGVCFWSNVFAAVVPVPKTSVDKDGYL